MLPHLLEAAGEARNAWGATAATAHGVLGEQWVKMGVEHEHQLGGEDDSKGQAGPEPAIPAALYGRR